MTLVLREPAGRHALDEVVGGGGLLAFDFDGTLAPIVREPASASPRASTRELLARLALAHPCAVISGRARQDVVERLRGIAFVEIIGNHGAEPPPPGTDESLIQRRVALWHTILAGELLGLPGIEIEDKRLSLAIHFRRARDQAAAEDRIRLALRAATGGRVVGGACVVNVVPEELPDKGGALRQLCARLGAESVLFVGDDTTDEDVFRAQIPGLVGVRVGRVASHAKYFLQDQEEIDDLLRELLQLASRRVAGAALASAARRTSVDGR
jgi:trehalose 6-phosphate phosphatase